jgi:hypothetical protein
MSEKAKMTMEEKISKLQEIANVTLSMWAGPGRWCCIFGNRYGPERREIIPILEGSPGYLGRTPTEAVNNCWRFATCSRPEFHILIKSPDYGIVRDVRWNRELNVWELYT